MIQKLHGQVMILFQKWATLEGTDDASVQMAPCLADAFFCFTCLDLGLSPSERYPHVQFFATLPGVCRRNKVCTNSTAILCIPPGMLASVPTEEQDLQVIDWRVKKG
jgi:hypothetical protein